MVRAYYYSVLLLVFFFQAEDGIRVRDVTGVQTCALPILVSNFLPDEQMSCQDECDDKPHRDADQVRRNRK